MARRARHPLQEDQVARCNQPVSPTAGILRLRAAHHAFRARLPFHSVPPDDNRFRSHPPDHIRRSSEMPVHPASVFGVGIPPGDSPLITCVHTRTAFDTILKLEDYLAVIIILVALSRTNVRRAVMRTHRIADPRVDQDVWSGFTSRLVSVGDQTETLRYAESLHLYNENSDSVNTERRLYRRRRLVSF